MVIAITILLGIILLCIITMAVMVSRAMPYDPAWDEWEKIEEKKEKR